MNYRDDMTLVAQVVAFNKAISDQQRMKMMKIVGSAEPNTMKVGDIADILGISQPAATKHLQILHDVGLISRERVGSCVYYSVSREGVARYQEVMNQAFAHVYTPCLNGFDCGSCPAGSTCA